MGSANTPEAIMKHYRRLNLSKCSLALISIPGSCTSMTFQDIFESCVKFNNMIPIGVYRKHDPDQNQSGEKIQEGIGARNEE